MQLTRWRTVATILVGAAVVVSVWWSIDFGRGAGPEERSARSGSENGLVDSHSNRDPVSNGSVHSEHLSPLDEYLRKVDASTHWGLPIDNRIGGVATVKLVASTEEWLRNLPPAQRIGAEAFLSRNRGAYAFSTREEHAWLIDHGFPALEEVAYFQGLPEGERNCEQDRCRSGKFAALVIDEQLAMVARGSEGIDLGGRSLAEYVFSPANDSPQVRELLGRLAKIDVATVRGARGGSLLFGLALHERQALLIGGDSPRGRRNAAVASALRAACGDARPPDRQYGADAEQARVAMLMLGGIPTMRQGQICGRPAGAPNFYPRRPAS